MCVCVCVCVCASARHIAGVANAPARLQVQGLRLFHASCICFIYVSYTCYIRITYVCATSSPRAPVVTYVVHPFPIRFSYCTDCTDTGFVLRHEGAGNGSLECVIVTNAHVAGLTVGLSVITYDGREFVGRLLGMSVCMCVCIYVCVCVCLCVYLYLYI